MKASHFLHKVCTRSDGSDSIEFGFEGSGGEFLNDLVIHAGLIERTDFLFNRRTCGRMRGSVFQDRAKELLIAFQKHVEPPPRRFVWRNRVGLHPSATRVLIEIVARINRLINGLQIYTALRLSESGAAKQDQKEALFYQTRQALAETMGCPSVQPKAAANSGMF